MLSPTFTFPWSQVGRWFGRPRVVSILDLPNDVFLEEIFTRIDVQDVITLRCVNRRLYALTHEAVIWKRLLRHMNVPIPPLPPTARHSMASLNNLEVERLLVRAVSLKRNLELRKPEPFYGSSVEAFHHVQSMCIVPGGKYLVASVKEERRDCYAIMLFTLDYRRGGALPLAKTSTPTKAYGLQAKYMTYQGQKGIMISYILRDTKKSRHRKAAGGVHISQMSHETVLDLNVPMVYTCMTLFTALGTLDNLSDPDILHPGSEPYNIFAMQQSPPFRLLAEMRSSSTLGPVCMDAIFGVPYLAVVKANDQIMFKNLLTEGFSTITCSSFGQPRETYTIVKIRFLASQASILVIRRVKNQCMLFETYPIPPIGQRVANAHAEKSVFLNRMDLDQIEITDQPPLASEHYNLDPDSPPDLTGQASRSISIFGTTVTDPQTGTRAICRISLVAKPWNVEKPLPRLPFRLPDKLEKDPVAKESFIRTYATHYYEIQNDTNLEPFGFNSRYGRMRVLPGSNYSLIYWTADTIKDCSHLTNLGIYFTPAPLGETGGDEPEVFEVEQVSVGGQMMKRKNQRIKFPYMWSDLWEELRENPMRCMAWDESIGRMCVVHEGDSRIHIVDFSKAPKEDMDGERLPIPVKLFDNPRKSSIFDGKFFFTTKL